MCTGRAHIIVTLPTYYLSEWLQYLNRSRDDDDDDDDGEAAAAI